MPLLSAIKIKKTATLVQLNLDEKPQMTTTNLHADIWYHFKIFG
jgi:hypothetical protein